MSDTYICPWCNVASVISGNRTVDSSRFFDNNKHGPMRVTVGSTTCLNDACREFSLHVFLDKILAGGPGRSESFKDFDDWQLRPSSAAKPMPDYIPAVIIEDYQEACAIAHLSPKASATLSRRCLQGIIRDYWGISLRTLNAEISALEDKIDFSTYQAIDAVRKIGNIGAHMERDINVVVDVDPEEATLLISMIEMVIKDWYISRNDREQRTKKLLELAAKKEAARKPVSSGSSHALPPPDTAG
ncbi:DUF4145 domain-containing protein [Xanthomonas sp. CFBP 7698]|uniref:DUF4145 domain-containing protein n=1 Tax=Xanthomonas sp. CFBP 7698 TaxID=2082399 RepID=UPI000EEF9383|nr:DUF4145 domain-containing protein [Xanthomonas sp. CFBP 7698]RJS04853.1 hypothetical protein XnspCFBP7698_00910 [Xanthomonas sp. CFBP 7698]